ncbi:MAG: hypothetical protein QQN63_05050, partial [Nitrosopumilus sp.]
VLAIFSNSKITNRGIIIFKFLKKSSDILNIKFDNILSKRAFVSGTKILSVTALTDAPADDDFWFMS